MKMIKKNFEIEIIICPHDEFFVPEVPREV